MVDFGVVAIVQISIIRSPDGTRDMQFERVIVFRDGADPVIAGLNAVRFALVPENCDRFVRDKIGNRDDVRDIGLRLCPATGIQM